MAPKSASFPQNKQFPYFQALNLDERIKHQRTQDSNPDIPDEACVQTVIAEWKAQYPFSEEAIFAERLAMIGISEKELPYYMNGGDPSSWVEGQAWMSELENAWILFDKEKEPIRFPKDLVTQWPIVRFLEAFQPLLQYAHANLIKGINDLCKNFAVTPFKHEDIIKAFMLNVPKYLTWAVSRTFVLELHIARLEGVLQAETPEERFEEFIKLLQQPSKLYTILQEYPVLTRLVCTILLQWRENFLEFLTHLCQDWGKLQVRFNLDGDYEQLKEVYTGAGDRHRNGHSVIIAKFTSGIRLVYKPRSLAIDEQFQSLLNFLNKHNNLVPQFKLLNVLNCKTHGWVEFIEAQTCQTPQAIKRFYKRQGAYLALLYALGASDFHFENIIAEGENPMLIDLETLFSPMLAGQVTNRIPADRFMATSVMSIHFLPNRIWAGEEGPEGVDISGLGMQEGQLTPNPLPIWQQVNTDEMHLLRTRMPITGHTHLPRLNDNKVEAIEYTPEIIQGFSAMYKLLIGLKDELMAVNGPLEKFGDTQVRVILRPTHIYSLLHQESLHPDLMQDALQLEQHFDRLWVGAFDEKYLRKVIPHEYKDLWNFDVPIFYSTPTSIDLWTSTNTKIERFFEASGLEQTKNKLNQMSHSDMLKQCWLIRTSLATLANKRNNELSDIPDISIVPLQSKPNLEPEKEQLLPEASKIGERLQQLAIHNNQFVSWLGISYTDKGDYWTIVPVGLSLYNGLLGIAMFLAYLGKITNNSTHTQLARKTIETILYQAENEEGLISAIGVFEGWGGIIYVLSHLGTLWNDDHLIEKATSIANSLEKKISEDSKFDIISGSAGCITALITLSKVTNLSYPLELAAICGDHLIANAKVLDGGIAWLQQNISTIDKPLTGFAHGVAGISWALSQLAEETQIVRYQKIAQKSLSYERNLYSTTFQNWPDLRNYTEYKDGALQDQPVYLNFWCHGAPGIGLSRLSTMKNTSIIDNQMKQEIDIAYHATMTKGFGNSHCLCHGDLGSLEFLSDANSYFELQQQKQINQLIQGVLSSIKKYGWLCGNGLRVEEPGLMTGLAGIGYQLLRLARPDVMPSVLTLEPPKLASSHP